MTLTRTLTLVATLLLSACGGSQSGSGGPSTHDARSDTGSADAGRTHDTGSASASSTRPRPDGGSRDTGSHDSGVRDSGARESSARDSGPADVGVPESSTEASTSKCTYPAGPYSSELGGVLNPALYWQAYAPGASSPSTLKVTDLYDCDGTKGINAIVFETAAQWCTICRFYATSLPGWMSSTAPNAGDWTALGAQWVTLVVQDNNDEPATIVTAEQWRDEYNLTSIYVAADPLAAFTTETVPYIVLVNPRTMVVMSLLFQEYYFVPGDAGALIEPDPAVAAMASQNQRDQ